jgi:hypothetical protein
VLEEGSLADPRVQRAADLAEAARRQREPLAEIQESGLAAHPVTQNPRLAAPAIRRIDRPIDSGRSSQQTQQ